VTQRHPDLGLRALDWLLRRLRQGAPLDTDLALVHAHPALEGTAGQVKHAGQTWRVATVGGELSLRAELLEDAPLIACIPPGFVPPPDLAGRAYMGRPLDLRAEDLVAALAGRFCAPLRDEALVRALPDALPRLVDWGDWGAGEVVSAREVRAALAAAALGLDATLARTPPHALLTRLVVEGPPVEPPGPAALSALRGRGREGRWLAWALEEGSVEALVTAGALAGTYPGQSAAPRVPGVDPQPQWQALRGLVERALRDAWGDHPARVTNALAQAEALARGLSLAADAVHHPLLRGPLEAALKDYAQAAAGGVPADDGKVEALAGSLHANALADDLSLVREASRLARFAQAMQPAPGASAVEHLYRALRDVAWADWSLRRLRRHLAGASPVLVALAKTNLEKTLAHRDAWNQAFAQALAREWPQVSASRDLRAPLPLQHLARSLLARLVKDGQRVFLVVLDGCDLSTFLELVDDLPARAGLGLVAPAAADASLFDDLRHIRGLHVGVSPLPTVTGHARRALFAGEVPGNTALDDAEAVAANASADQVAWKRNAALGAIRRRLFLKGDLGDGGAALHETLRRGDEALVAAVFNGVDDALSSHETTALGPWSFAGLGGGALEALRAATESGWTVVVTSDHGHTPYLESARKVAPRADGQRFSSAPLPGAVTFDQGPLPTRPLHLLAQVGAWNGNQRRGFHGGAGLEEVAVPIAFLGPVEAGQGRARAPEWWWSGPEPAAAVVVVAPALAMAAEPLATAPVLTTEDSPPTPPAPAAQTATEPPLPEGLPWLVDLPAGGVRRLFAHLAQWGSVGEVEATAMLGSPSKLRRFSRKLEGYTEAAPFGVRVEVTGGGKRYVREG